MYVRNQKEFIISRGDRKIQKEEILWLKAAKFIFFIGNSRQKYHGANMYQIRHATDRNYSRSPSCRLCQGQSPGHWGLLSEPPLWTVSCNPNLTDLLQNRRNRKTLITPKKGDTTTKHKNRYKTEDDN